MKTAVSKSFERETLEEQVVALLKERGMTLTTAESCTGGMLSGRIVNVAGVSEVFKEGYVTYANESKEKLLGVKHETLERYSAVSEETAYEMAKGARKMANADAALAVTGIAGPDGGTKEKPVGLVYIGCAVGEKVIVQKFLFDGERSEIRGQAAEMALEMLRAALENE